MNRMSLAALLSCLPLVAWADNPVKLDTPVSGWRAGDGSAANYRQVVNYPASSVNVAADQATTARIRGAIESQPKDRPATLVVNGVSMPLKVDADGSFDRPFAFPSGSNSVEVRNAAGQSRRVQFYHGGGGGEVPAKLRVLLSWDSDNTDLDLHLVTPDGDHVWYGNRSLANGATLDVDVTTGYGPEIIATPTPQKGPYLGEMAKISAAMHAPFISAASPTVMGMGSWQELSNPRDLTKIFTTPEYAGWRSLRESEDSRYIGLTMPRFLARLPYGAKTDPVEEFAFEEETDGADSSKYAWANSAYAMAVNINRSFKLYGWCSRIRGVESGGEVQGLPAHTFPTDDGGVDMKCPTEIAISDRREAELAKNGFMPLLHKKNTDFAAFIGAQSLQKPAEYDDPDATANANLAARLPYLFATCRFAHYLKCIVRDKIGSFKEKDEMQRWLQDWILNYVDGDPAHSTETTKAQHPLAAAEVVVEEVEGNPGYYNSKFFLRPHYQLEGLTVSLRLVSKLPSAKEA